MVKRKDHPEDAPQIAEIYPKAAIAGGEIHIRGKGLARSHRPKVTIGDVEAPIIIGSDTLVVVKVPEDTRTGLLEVRDGGSAGASVDCAVGVPMADGLHPVANPAVDAEGNVFATFSGSRGQKTPVSVYRVDASYEAKPFLSDIMNATGLAFDRDGILYVSSRYDGIVYQATPSGTVSVYVEGMGVATGICFDPEENLYVGDRSGTIFKISRDRQIYVFATVEPSIAAYHLAFGPDGHLYVTGPTTSSFDSVYRVAPTGDVEIYYRGLGRPQGLAFDHETNLYVAASLGGRRGIVRIAPDDQHGAEVFLSGPNIVGLAFAPGGAMVVATNSALYRVDVDTPGRPLL
jgi:sugar lactone lactonase YvrE